jgi:hypothetical protein
LDGTTAPCCPPVSSHMAWASADLSPTLKVWCGRHQVLSSHHGTDRMTHYPLCLPAQLVTKPPDIQFLLCAYATPTFDRARWPPNPSLPVSEPRAASALGTGLSPTRTRLEGGCVYAAGRFGLAPFSCFCERRSRARGVFCLVRRLAIGAANRRPAERKQRLE